MLPSNVPGAHVLDRSAAVALCRLTTRLAATPTLSEMALAIAATAHDVAGGSYAQLGILNEAGDELVLHHGAALDHRAQ